MKFRYKKCNNGRKFLMERNDIVAMRVRFLRHMVNLRTNNDDRPVVYLDETWVNQNHTRNHIWPYIKTLITLKDLKYLQVRAVALLYVMLVRDHLGL